MANYDDIFNASQSVETDEKSWGCCKCKLIAGNSLFPYAKYAYLSDEFCLRQ